MLILAKLLLFATILLCIYLFIDFMDKDKIISKYINLTETSSKNRSLEKEKVRLEEGNIKDTSILSKIDRCIEGSYIKSKFSFINTELFIFINIILSIFAFFIGISITNYWLVGFIFSFLVFLISYLFIFILSRINYEKLDKNMLTFTNMLENYSSTSDDIVTIMNNTCPYLQNPLKRYVEEFCNEAISTGDTTRAFRRLEFKISNDRLKDIIRNIEICSRHEANYQEIIKDTRDTLKDYLKGKQQRKQMINNGRIEIAMCLSMSAIIIYVFNSLVPNLFFKLKSTTIGSIILLYACIVIGIIILKMFSFGEGE